MCVFVYMYSHTYARACTRGCTRMRTHGCVTARSRARAGVCARARGRLRVGAYTRAHVREHPRTRARVGCARGRTGEADTRARGRARPTNHRSWMLQDSVIRLAFTKIS